MLEENLVGANTVMACTCLEWEMKGFQVGTTRGCNKLRTFGMRLGLGRASAAGVHTILSSVEKTSRKG